MLTTITSASAARSRAPSAKHTGPLGQRLAPGHSSLPTLTALHARSVGAQVSSAWSPVRVVRLQSVRRRISSLVVAANSSISSCPVVFDSSSSMRCMQT